MKLFAVDASVVLKALLKENPLVFNKFESLLKNVKEGKISILSSKLLGIEVANGLRFSIKDQQICLNIMKDFSSLPIKTIVLSKNQIYLAIKTSYELETTVYDTSYHILAKAYGAMFYTSDEVYYKKAKILGDIEFIG